MVFYQWQMQLHSSYAANTIHIHRKPNQKTMLPSPSVPGFIILLMVVLITGCCLHPCPDKEIPAAGATMKSIGPASPRVLTSVPDVRQSTPYSCGAASLQAVLNYWGRDYREDELRVMLNTTEEGGTDPDAIVNVSRSLGFSAEARTDMTIADLEAAVSAGIPVIVGVQEWKDRTSPPFWVDLRGEGHYMVIIGIDEKNVYLEDPAILGMRGEISRDDFMDHWLDLSGKDIRDPAAMRYRRVAVFIRGDEPAQYPEFITVGFTPQGSLKQERP